MLSSTGSYSALLIAQLFISDWVDLLTDVLAAVPEARGRLLLDMINEPDGYGFTWYGWPAQITLCQALWVTHRACMCSVVRLLLHSMLSQAHSREVRCACCAEHMCSMHTGLGAVCPQGWQCHYERALMASLYRLQT